MPILESKYKPPFLFKNGDFQTLYSSLIRRAPVLQYLRERIETHDHDFLDLDWVDNKSDKLVIISHGIEGSSRSKYIKCMISGLMQSGFDCLAWNFRGCSGSDNLNLRLYHSGVSDDLECVVNHAISKNKYREIYLVGFSMGGNITLKYVGEHADRIPEEIKRVVAIATPCDLKSAVRRMGKRRNKIYMRRFLNLLKNKLISKSKNFPENVSLINYKKIKNFIDFDTTYTAPMHGFESAEDYWEKCNSKQFIHNIKVPTLLLNAKDDPFLSEECYPYAEADSNPNFFLEVPRYGGHVGFVDFRTRGTYWAEKRVVDFFTQK